MSVTTYLGTSYKIWYWSLYMTLRGIHLHLVSICALVSIYSYKLTVSNGGGGSFGFGIYMVSIYSYKLTVSNGGGGSFGFGISIWSLYILISWLFQMGEGVISHWYLYVHWSLYILISWPFWMGSHLWHRSAKSSLLLLAVSSWGRGVHLPLVSICAVSSICIDLPLHEIYQ